MYRPIVTFVTLATLLFVVFAMDADAQRRARTYDRTQYDRYHRNLTPEERAAQEAIREAFDMP